MAVALSLRLNDQTLSRHGTGTGMKDSTKKKKSSVIRQTAAKQLIPLMGVTIVPFFTNLKDGMNSDLIIDYLETISGEYAIRRKK